MAEIVKPTPQAPPAPPKPTPTQGPEVVNASVTLAQHLANIAGIGGLTAKIRSVAKLMGDIFGFAKTLQGTDASQGNIPAVATKPTTPKPEQTEPPQSQPTQGPQVTPEPPQASPLDVTPPPVQPTAPGPPAQTTRGPAATADEDWESLREAVDGPTQPTASGPPSQPSAPTTQPPTSAAGPPSPQATPPKPMDPYMPSRGPSRPTPRPTTVPPVTAPATTGPAVVSTAARAATAAVPTAPAAAGAAGGASAAGGGAIASLAAAAGPVAIAFAAVAAAGALAVMGIKTFVGIIKDQAQKIEGYSGSTALAVSISELRHEQAMIRRAERIGPDVAKWESLRGRASEKLEDAGTEILKMMFDFMKKYEPAIVAIVDAITLIPPAIDLAAQAVQVQWDMMSGDLFGLAENIGEGVEAAKKLKKAFDDYIDGKNEEDVKDLWDEFDAILPQRLAKGRDAIGPVGGPGAGAGPAFLGGGGP